MFTVGASTVSTNTEHYDFSLKVIQVLLVSKLFFVTRVVVFLLLFVQVIFFSTAGLLY